MSGPSSGLRAAKCEDFLTVGPTTSRGGTISGAVRSLARTRDVILNLHAGGAGTIDQTAQIMPFWWRADWRAQPFDTGGLRFGPT